MQARFERASIRTIWRLVDQPRFRAAVDFLQLRAEAREVDSVLAQWWMDLANSGTETRSAMIDVWQAGHSTARTRPTRRRRRTNTTGAAADSTPGEQATH